MVAYQTKHGLSEYPALDVWFYSVLVRQAVAAVNSLVAGADWPGVSYGSCSQDAGQIQGARGIDLTAAFKVIFSFKI